MVDLTQKRQHHDIVNRTRRKAAAPKPTHADIARDLRAFRAAGGKVQKVPTGVSGLAPIKLTKTDRAQLKRHPNG